MNIMKEIPTGKCGAKRCPNAATHTYPGMCWNLGDDVNVPLCDRHVEEADKEFGLSEVEGAVVPLAPRVLVTSDTPPFGTDSIAETQAEMVAADKALVAQIPAEKLPEIAEAVAAKVAEAPPVAELAVPEKEIAAETAEAKSVLDYVKEMVIETQGDLDDANQDLKEVKARAKKLKARQEEITKPLNAALKSIRDLFRPAMDCYGQIEVEIKKRIAEHVEAQEERNRAAMLEASAGNHEALAAVTHIGEVEGLSTRSTWDFIVEDEALVPREFLAVDEKKLGAYARAAKDGAPAPVPGVRFVPKTIVVSRSA